MATLVGPRKTDKDREKWLVHVDQLVHQVRGWAKERKWAVQSDTKRIRESKLGEYTVPVISILAPASMIQLDPVARFAADGEGRVDLIAWPSLNRMLLIRDGDVWKILTDSGIAWPKKWNQRTFDQLVELLGATA